MRPTPGTVMVFYHYGKLRPCVVLESDHETATIIYPTRSKRDYSPRLHVRCGSATARRMKLQRESWFYPFNIADVGVNELEITGHNGWCPPHVLDEFKKMLRYRRSSSFIDPWERLDRSVEQLKDRKLSVTLGELLGTKQPTS